MEAVRERNVDSVDGWVVKQLWIVGISNPRRETRYTVSSGTTDLDRLQDGRDVILLGVSLRLCFVPSSDSCNDDLWV